MFPDTQNLILLIVFIIVGVIAVICCIYCCVCKPACAKTRQRLIGEQIARDEAGIDEEREANRAQIRDALSANEQRRNEIRDKYQLK